MTEAVSNKKRVQNRFIGARNLIVFACGDKYTVITACEMLLFSNAEIM